MDDRRLFDHHAPDLTPGNPPTTAIFWGRRDLRGIPSKRGPQSKHLPPHEIWRWRGDASKGHLAAGPLTATYWRSLLGRFTLRR